MHTRLLPCNSHLMRFVYISIALKTKLHENIILLLLHILTMTLRFICKLVELVFECVDVCCIKLHVLLKSTTVRFELWSLNAATINQMFKGELQSLNAVVLKPFRRALALCACH